MFMELIFSLVTFRYSSYLFVSTLQITLSPFDVMVDEIRLTMISASISWYLCQFIVMYQKIRCSILFHFETPDRKAWHADFQTGSGCNLRRLSEPSGSCEKI